MAIVSLKPWGRRSCLALGLAQECAQKGNLCSHSRDTGRDGAKRPPQAPQLVLGQLRGLTLPAIPTSRDPGGSLSSPPQPSSPAVTDSFQPCAHQHQGVRVWIFRVILLIQPYKTFPTTSLPPPLSSKKQWHERERGTNQAAGLLTALLNFSSPRVISGMMLTSSFFSDTMALKTQQIMTKIKVP